MWCANVSPVFKQSKTWNPRVLPQAILTKGRHIPRIRYLSRPPSSAHNLNPFDGLLSMKISLRSGASLTHSKRPRTLKDGRKSSILVILPGSFCLNQMGHLNSAGASVSSRLTLSHACVVRLGFESFRSISRLHAHASCAAHHVPNPVNHEKYDTTRTISFTETIVCRWSSLKLRFDN